MAQLYHHLQRFLGAQLTLLLVNCLEKFLILIWILGVAGWSTMSKITLDRAVTARRVLRDPAVSLKCMFIRPLAAYKSVRNGPTANRGSASQSPTSAVLQILGLSAHKRQKQCI